MSEEDVEALPLALPESIEDDKYVLATYYAAVPRDWPIDKIAMAVAVEQSTGTWIRVPGETVELRKKHIAKVIAISEVPDFEYEVPADVKLRRYIVQIAYPYENFMNEISMLLTTIIGNISMAGRLKLVDVKFPKSYLEMFKGPKFGVQGIREYLKIPRRPLLNNMIKPCTGYPPEVGAKLAYEALVGGADFVKDDELLANAPFNTVEDRIVKYMEVVDKAAQETGEKKMYTINVTADAPKIFEFAEKVIELGANAIMVNHLVTGIGVLKALAEDPSIKVPILGHMDFAGAVYEDAESGMSSHLILGKLPRLAGADILVYPAPYGKQPFFLKEKYLKVGRSMLFPMYNIKPTLPMPSGGITQIHVPQLISDLGTNIAIGAGGAIHAHPMGPKAGAKAFRQAIEAAMNRVPIDQYAEEHPELKAAIEAWKAGPVSLLLE
ncbi:MAG: RuBisCO large subunit C-terminal-like domain-containing protein [Candidatus Bathyarchaeales archaeon]